MKQFNIRTDVYFGRNALSRLDEVKNKRVLIICDEFIEKSGIVNKVREHLPSCQIYVYSKIVPDPPIEVVAEGIRCLVQCKAEVLIAVGGGSSIDAAKVIREMTRQMEYSDVDECYAIPTTSGTGSEVTKFSVITNSSEGVKLTLEDHCLQPMTAILDPEMVKSVPPAITADTGMDALTHALEAYVSTEANPFTDALAEKAAVLLFENLPKAYSDGNDSAARECVQNAACLAGMAFNTAGVGLCHSISHAIGGRLHISHGRGNAIALPKVILFNAELDKAEATACARKYQRMAALIGIPCNNVIIAVNNLVRKIEELNSAFHIPENLAGLNVEPEKLKKEKPEMIQVALRDSTIQTNPRKVELADLEKLFDVIIPL